jgi:hypothetical protein
VNWAWTMEDAWAGSAKTAAWTLDGRAEKTEALAAALLRC